jgi:hypothetical protein
MEEKDLKQIKEVIDQSFDDKFGQIWEHNIAPAFDDVYKRLDKTDVRMDGFDGKMVGFESMFDRIDSRLNRIESQMVTKSYLDDKLADLEGSMNVKMRKEDEKVNGVIDSLKKHKIVPIEELKDLDNLQIFPRVQL